MVGVCRRGFGNRYVWGLGWTSLERGRSGVVNLEPRVGLDMHTQGYKGGCRPTRMDFSPSPSSSSFNVIRQYAYQGLEEDVGL